MCIHAIIWNVLNCFISLCRINLPPRFINFFWKLHLFIWKIIILKNPAYNEIWIIEDVNFQKKTRFCCCVYFTPSFGLIFGKYNFNGKLQYNQLKKYSFNKKSIYSVISTIGGEIHFKEKNTILLFCRIQPTPPGLIFGKKPGYNRVKGTWL